MKLEPIQSICKQDIPKKYIDDDFLDQLPVNGGNVLSVDRDSDFGKFLERNGYQFNMPRDSDGRKFKKTWGWLVVFR